VVKSLFINGCSFLEIYDRFLCNITAGHHLAEKLNLNPIGYASAGRGNDRIVATTKLFFYDNPELIKDTFALIGWSHVIRHDYLKISARLRRSPKNGLTRTGKKKDRGKKGFFDWGSWKFTKALRTENKDLPMEYDINKSMRLRYLEHVLSLQDFFKVNDIKYCMYNALENNYPSGQGLNRQDKASLGLDRLAEKVDKQRFFQFDKESHLEFVKNSRCQPDRENRLTLSDIDDHPNRRGHKLWGDRLHAFIKENYLL